MIPCTEGLHLKMYSYAAIHKQVAVPLHFREAVLGRNQSGCQITLIRMVGPGEPFKWCARMVNTSKKDGKPCKSKSRAWGRTQLTRLSGQDYRKQPDQANGRHQAGHARQQYWHEPSRLMI